MTEEQRQGGHDAAIYMERYLIIFCHDGFDPLELLGGDWTSRGFSWASCSKNPDQSSARDSFLAPLLEKNSVDNCGVLGVRCHGEMGIFDVGFEAPGRASPDCSRCSDEE